MRIMALTVDIYVAPVCVISEVHERERTMRLLLSRVRRVTRWLKGGFRYSIFSSELDTGALWD
jgi:hypothetical protein